MKEWYSYDRWGNAWYTQAFGFEDRITTNQWHGETNTTKPGSSIAEDIEWEEVTDKTNNHE